MDSVNDLARRHDDALFHRAFPISRAEMAGAERDLRGFRRLVRGLEVSGADLSALDEFETSGIAGTTILMDFSWGMARWLARRYPGSVFLSWNAEPPEARLAATLPRFLPFLEERALADNGTDFRAWLDAALPGKARDRGLRWLVDRFSELPLDDTGRSELWDALGFLVRWELGALPASRTLARIPNAVPFISAEPLVPRSLVSVVAEVEGPPPSWTRLPADEGEAFLDAARAAVAVRYRELHAFTWGNRADVVHGDLGRGLRVFCCGLLPEQRLPLRAGYGFLLVRNGVPVGYGDAYALGERIDLSFNVFYAFRKGESAFTYARTAAFFASLLGTRTIAVDPYQFGRDNEEAIGSGAFWFYRKLGFRSAEPILEKLARREEARVAASPSYRTPAAALRRLAGAPLVLSTPGASGAWERFSLDRIGLAIQRRMASSGLSPDRFQSACVARIARRMGTDPSSIPLRETRAFRQLAPVLDLLDLPTRLSPGQLSSVRSLVGAKAGRSESRFARLLADSGPVGGNLLRLGSTSAQRIRHES